MRVAISVCKRFHARPSRRRWWDHTDSKRTQAEAIQEDEGQGHCQVWSHSPGTWCVRVTVYQISNISITSSQLTQFAKSYFPTDYVFMMVFKNRGLYGGSMIPAGRRRPQVATGVGFEGRQGSTLNCEREVATFEIWYYAPENTSCPRLTQCGLRRMSAKPLTIYSTG